MKHLNKYKSFNESDTFKNDNSDIELFFTDYTDEDSSALTITNGLVRDGKFVNETTYIKDTSKYKRAKLITLRIGKPTGINTINGKCMDDLDMLSNALFDIKRFYTLSGEDVNYIINTDFMGLYVRFITLGGVVKSEETQYTKIDEYLKRISDCMKKKGHKRQVLKGNWLEIKFSKRNDYSYGVSSKLINISNGAVNSENANNDIDIELVKIRDEAWGDDLKFDISGGDQQVVLRLVKR